MSHRADSFSVCLCVCLCVLRESFFSGSPLHLCALCYGSPEALTYSLMESQKPPPVNTSINNLFLSLSISSLSFNLSFYHSLLPPPPPLSLSLLPDCCLCACKIQLDCRGAGRPPLQPARVTFHLQWIMGQRETRPESRKTLLCSSCWTLPQLFNTFYLHKLFSLCSSHSSGVWNPQSWRPSSPHGAGSFCNIDRPSLLLQSCPTTLQVIVERPYGWQGGPWDTTKNIFF